MIESIKILDIPFNRITLNEALSIIEKWLKEDKKRHIATPNPEMILEAENNVKFRNVLNKTDLNVPDGIGILWASTYIHKTAKNRFKTTKILKGIELLFSLIFFPSVCKKILKERVSGVDLMLKICESAAKNNNPIFLLGATDGVAEKTAEKLKQHFPALKISGTYAGKPEDKNLVDKINRTNAEILFVAYGAPKQDTWIHENLEKLNNIKITMSVGGSFDFISGYKKRAPKLMRKLGLEWLFRLIQEPKRIRRIYNAVIKFPLLIITKY